MNDNIWIISVEDDQVYEIRFQGKPVNMFPLINSNREKIKEKSKTNAIFLSTNIPANKTANPKKKDKNNGIKITAKGINPLNISSWVKDIEIQ